jgi:hypothetical protein
MLLFVGYCPLADVQVEGLRMDADEKTGLATIAIRRLRRTANDSERWSFAYRTEGAEGFIYWTTHQRAGPRDSYCASRSGRDRRPGQDRCYGSQGLGCLFEGEGRIGG